MKQIIIEWETEECNDTDAILDSIFDILLPDSELCGEDDLDNERSCGVGNSDHTSKA